MNRIFVIILCLYACSFAEAQKMPVVADMDTRLPLLGVVVSTDNGQRVMTDNFGHFHTQLPFASATVSKKHYLQRRVSGLELHKDTLFLIPQEVVLEDVVVKAPGMAFDMQKSMCRISENAKLNEQARQGFNLLGIFGLFFPSKKMKAAGRAESIKKILDKY